MARNKPKTDKYDSENESKPDVNFDENVSKKGSKKLKKQVKKPSKKVPKPKKQKVNKSQNKSSKPSKKGSKNAKVVKDSATKLYKSTPVAIEWLKRTGNNIIGVLDDVSKGSNHYILTKQLLMVGAAFIVAVIGWNISTSKEAKVLRESAFNQTLFSNKSANNFSKSGTVVTASKVYKSSDGKSVYVPVTFENSTPAQMPMRPNQMKTEIQYAGSVIDSSKLSAEMVGYPALDGKMFYVYIIHKPDNKFTNVSSRFTTKVTQDLVSQSTNSNDSSGSDNSKDTLTFTVDLGAKNITKLSSNDTDDNLKQIYANTVVNDQAKELISSSKQTLESNTPLYNQATSLETTLREGNVKLPTVPKFALKQNDGNIYNINFESNFIKGYFPKSSYGSLKSQYLGSGYSQNTEQFNVGLDAFNNPPQFTNNTDLSSTDTALSTSYQTLSSTYSEIIRNKQTAYVSNAQQIFTLQYQFDNNLTEKTVSDDDSFDITSLNK